MMDHPTDSHDIVMFNVVPSFLLLLSVEMALLKHENPVIRASIMVSHDIVMLNVVRSFLLLLCVVMAL